MAKDWIHFVPDDVGQSFVDKPVRYLASRQLGGVRTGDRVWLFHFSPGSRAFELYGRLRVRGHWAPAELMGRDARALAGEFLVEAAAPELGWRARLGPEGGVKLRLAGDPRSTLEMEDQELHGCHEVTERTAGWLEAAWALGLERREEREREEARVADWERARELGEPVAVRTPWGILMVGPASQALGDAWQAGRARGRRVPWP